MLTMFKKAAETAVKNRSSFLTSSFQYLGASAGIALGIAASCAESQMLQDRNSADEANESVEKKRNGPK